MSGLANGPFSNCSIILIGHPFCLKVSGGRFGKPYLPSLGEQIMLAKAFWLTLVGMGLVSGVAAGRGMLRPEENLAKKANGKVTIEDRSDLNSVAAQRYVNNQARHWRALVVQK